MDALDFSLLTALARTPRATYGELGVRLGLTANAVKARVARLLSTGVLQGFAALPDPAALGMREGLLHFTGVDDLDEREDEILRGLAEVPGVRFADASHDHSVWAWVLSRDDEDFERIERAAISLVGKPPADRIVGPASVPERALSPQDWKVIRALQPDGRAHAKDLTARASLSFKPLKRRLDALLAKGDVRVVPVVSPAEAAGAVLFRVVLFLAPGTPAPALPSDALVSLEAPGVVTVLLQRPTLRAAREAHRALATLPGVTRAHLQIATRRASLAWLDEALLRRSAPTPAAPAPPLAPVPRAR